MFIGLDAMEKEIVFVSTTVISARPSAITEPLSMDNKLEVIFAQGQQHSRLPDTVSVPLHGGLFVFRDKSTQGEELCLEHDAEELRLKLLHFYPFIVNSLVANH